MTQFQGWFFSGLLVVVTALPSFAVTRYVDVDGTAPAAPYTNWITAAVAIQTAIDVASDGDEIRVAAGTYLLSGSPVTIPQDKALTLRSVPSGRAIIDAQSLSVGLILNGSNSWVEGFTIQNGYSTGSGGGVLLNNVCTLRDCSIIRSQAWGGGGLFINAAAVLENCTIQSNLATYYGGGAVIYAAAPALLLNCIVADNIASNYGGGVHCQEGGTISNSLIVRNQSNLEGGGIYFENGGRVVNSVVAGNQAVMYGGGFYTSATAPVQVPIINCTVVSNTAGLEGGGLFGYSSLLVNDILYFNAAPTNENLALSGTNNTIHSCCASPDLGGSNFATAPTFVDASALDYHLATASSCIDAGATNDAPSIDFDGHMRPRTGTPGGTAEFDVGAFEYGFHFNEIHSLDTNQVELIWDVQNRGIYGVDATTNDLSQPVWFDVSSYTNGGGLGVYTQTLVIPSPAPPYAGFRLRVGHTIF